MAGFCEAIPPGCAGEAKRAFAASFERSGAVFNIKRCSTQREEPRLREAGRRCRRQSIPCLLRGLPAVCPSGAYASLQLSRGA